MSPDLSVVVASRGRPHLLARCLAALMLQDHPRLEVVLVSDAEGLAVRPDLPLKRVGFDRPNLAMARNLGIAQAAGRVVAFIDDDAVAEPCWASALAAAFRDAQVIAATGPVRGRDGVQWQARAEWLTADGPHPLADGSARLWLAEPGATLSTIGTNCAFRRDSLVAVGGFDPLFAFHLEESDLNLRLAATFPRSATAFVPDALVAHAAATGTTRHHGAPSSLGAIGHSEAVFARRHGATPGWQDRVRGRERARLLRAVLAGRLDPFHLPGVMATLEAGLAEGEALADIAAIAALAHDPPPAPPAFAAIGTQARPHRVLSGWHWQARHLRGLAAAAAAEGALVSLMLWSPSFLPHQEGFVPGGWWERRGGIWGRGAAGEGWMVVRRRAARNRDLVRCWSATRGRRVPA